MVYIYVAGKRVAVHSRDRSRGGYTTVADHLSSQHQAYKQRSPAYYIDRARKLSPELHLLIQQVFGQDRYPEQLYRTCDGMMRLQRTTPAPEFAASTSCRS